MAAPPPPAVPYPCPRCQTMLEAGAAGCVCGWNLAMGLAPTPAARPTLPRPLLAVGALVAVLAIVGGGYLALSGKKAETGPAATPAEAWQTFSPPDGSWSAKFPGESEPQKMSMDMGMSGGSTSIKIEMTFYMVEESRTTAYAVAYFDMPSGVDEDTDAMFDRMERTVPGNMGADLVSSRASTVAGHPARELKVAGGPQNVEATIRLALIDERLYMLMALGKKGETLYAQYFCESFALGQPG